MASTTAKLLLLLLGEDRTASKALKGVGSQADKTSTTLGKAQKALKGFLAATAVTAAVKVLGDLVEAGEKASTSNARLEQVMRSMGHTTDDAAKAQLSYADELARTTGVDQNTIKLTQAKLATFRSLSSEVGLQEGIFKRATDAAVDLAATGFGTAETNAAQLGKALEDPVKGLGSLARAGVTFTEQQKDQIKTLVASNQKLAAQKIVLQAIEDQVGGVAEATANASDKYNVAVSQMQEALGERLLPAFENLTQAGMDLADTTKENTSAFGPLIDTATALTDILSRLTGATKDSDSALSKMLKTVNEISGVAGVQGLANAYLGWSDSADEATTATDGSTDALKDQATAAKKSTRAISGNTDALDDNTGAVDDNKRAQKTWLNSVDDSIKSLKEAKKQLRELEKQAKRLDGTKIRFSVSASMNRAADEIVYSVKGGGSMKFTAKAGGGYAPPGWVLRGENGPELTRETGSTYTKTAGGTRMAMGGGGQPVYITINAGLGSDPVAVGNGVVKALKAAQAAQSGRPFDIKTR